MVISDWKLIFLNRYLKENTFVKDRAAEYLEVTERHLTRLLKQWNQDGIITYQQGRGRGNHSIVKFNIDIEEVFINEYLQDIESLSIEDIRRILQLPLSRQAKQFIKTNLENKLFSRNNADSMIKETFVDYYLELPDFRNEVIRCDFSIMTLALNTTNRLYEISEEGKLRYGIVRHDEWQGNSLIIYLRKDIQFYNGQTMCANVVIENLERIFNQKNVAGIKKYLISIDSIDAFKFSITLTDRFEVIRYILSRLDTSIFLIKNSKTLTAGPYYVDSHDSDTIYLNRNPYFSGKTSDITHIEMTCNPVKYNEYVQNHKITNVALNENLIMTYVLFNPNSDLFNLNERRELRKIIIQFLSSKGYIDEAAIEEKRKNNPLHLYRPLRIIIDNNYLETSKLLEYINAQGIPAIGISIDDSIHEADVYLGKSFTEKHFFFNMIVFEPFGDWFINLQEGRRLINVYKNNNVAEWNISEKRFESWLYHQSYYVPAIRNVRHVNVPDKFINVRGNEYSTVKFNQFLIKSGQTID